MTKKIQVEIEGVGEGLLMHNPDAMSGDVVTKNPAKQYDPKVDAEKAAYRDDNGQLYVPARCIKACLINAASWFKFGKKSAKPIIAGCTSIDPARVSLGTKTYDIDRRPVVVQRSRIMRARPLLRKWKLKFNIVYNEKMIGETGIILKILEEAGQRIGLLDNRPQRYGENGTFKVTKFKPAR